MSYGQGIRYIVVERCRKCHFCEVNGGADVTDVVKQVPCTREVATSCGPVVSTGSAATQAKKKKRQKRKLPNEDGAPTADEQVENHREKRGGDDDGWHQVDGKRGKWSKWQWAEWRRQKISLQWEAWHDAAEKLRRQELLREAAARRIQAWLQASKRRLKAHPLNDPLPTQEQPVRARAGGEDDREVQVGEKHVVRDDPVCLSGATAEGNPKKKGKKKKPKNSDNDEDERLLDEAAGVVAAEKASLKESGKVSAQTLQLEINDRNLRCHAQHKCEAVVTTESTSCWMCVQSVAAGAAVAACHACNFTLCRKCVGSFVGG